MILHRILEGMLVSFNSCDGLCELLALIVGAIIVLAIYLVGVALLVTGTVFVIKSLREGMKNERKN